MNCECPMCKFKFDLPDQPARFLKRKQPCGCIVCTCIDEERCHSCGAKRCGKPDCVLSEPGQPRAVYATTLDQLAQDDVDFAGFAEEVKATQPRVLDMIQRNKFVFTDIGCEPGNWQHLAFTLYTEIVSLHSKADALLAAARGDQ